MNKGIPGQWVLPSQGRGVIEQRRCKAGQWRGGRSQRVMGARCLGTQVRVSREEVVTGGFWGICLKRLADKHQKGLWVSCSDERAEGGKARQDPGRDTGSLNCDDAGLVLSNFNFLPTRHEGGFPGVSDGKESSCNAGDSSSIPESGRSPGEGNGYLLQCSCLGNPVDDWRAAVHGDLRSWMWQSD